MKEKVIPEDILNLVNLEYLQIYHDQIKKIPKILPQNLVSFEMEKNKIKFIPKNIFTLKLDFLLLSYNQIKSMFNISKLINLKYLDLSHNKISKISNSLNLPNLKNLKLNNNLIRKIPKIFHLPNLEIFYIHFDNFYYDKRYLGKIRKIPKTLNLPKLKEFYLGGNKINGI